MNKSHKDNVEEQKINQVAEEYMMLFIYNVKLYK